MSKNIIKMPADPTCEPPPGGLGVLFMEKMKEYGTNLAQIDANTGESETYSQVLLKTIRVAQQMQARGFTEDDIVTLCTYNRLESILPYVACLFLGIKVSALDPTLSVNDCQHLLGIVKSKYVFCDEESVEMIEIAAEKAGLDVNIVVFGESVTHTSFSEFLIGNGQEDKFEVKFVKYLYDTAIIFFSSGTTGLPKGICTSHYGLIKNQLLTAKYDFRTCLYFTTFYWISSVQVLIYTMLNGTTRLLIRKFDPETTMELIQKYKVTYIFSSPFIANNLMLCPNFYLYNTSSVAHYTIGGGIVTEEQLLSLRKHFPHTLICHGYGMTENQGFVTYFHPVKDKELIKENFTSVGRGLSGFIYKVVNFETKEILGPNQQGELFIKSNSLMTGYYNNPKETKSAWNDEGFLRTGDILYYDKDLFFYVVDRAKDVIKYQSWHVPPAELERILLTHPAVRDAVVVGIPHLIDGEHPMGAVVLKHDAIATEEEILKFLNDRVTNRKKLHGGLKILSHIPRTPSGKLQRRLIRDMFNKDGI